MTTSSVTIDPASVFNNADERQIEFNGEVDGELRPFALRYEVLEALAGRVPDEDDAFALFQRHRDDIGGLAARALARDSDQATVVISGNDLA